MNRLKAHTTAITLILISFSLSVLFFGVLVVALWSVGYPAPSGARLGKSEVQLLDAEMKPISPLNASIPSHALQKAIKHTSRIMDIPEGKLAVIPREGGYVAILVGRPLISNPSGMAPFAIVIALITMAVATSVVILIYLRATAVRARTVFNRIENGDLGARFNVTRLDQVGQVGVQFNLMADKIENLVNQLKAKELQRTELLQELAHDTRTPLTTMRYLVEQLMDSREELTDQEVSDRLQILGREVQYFHRMIEDLFLLSELAQGPKRGREVELAGILEDEVSRLQGLLEVEGRPIEVVAEVDPEITAFIWGDPYLFGRLFRNMLENAAFHAKASITVIAQLLEGGGVSFSVRDDGPGFTAETMATFGTRQRSRFMDSSARKKISLGLGSVIMKSILESYEGELVVGNWPKNGSQRGAEVTALFPQARICFSSDAKASGI